MITHNLVQGTPAWHAYRAEHDNASDAPAMMGCSPYKSRSELMAEAHTGLTPEVGPQLQRIFNDGHRYEALARPLAEAIIGDDLYPITGSLGRMSASFDGLTMDQRIDFEHKSLNDTLRAAFANIDTIAPEYRDANGGTELPMVYQVQMEQQLAVSGAEKCLFMASKWDGDELVEERHCWYMPNLELRQRIVDGWAQFHTDLAAYSPVEEAAAPVGRTPDTLPALHIEVTGMVTASNLATFKSHALDVFEGINRDLVTDADFADAEKTIKWAGDVEQRLAAAKQHALSQTTSIDALFRTIDDISAEARRVRLELDKLVKNRKDSIRSDIVTDGRNAMAEHITALNARIGRVLMPACPADFAGVIKGKRTLESMRDAVATELARAKIEASAVADKITLNLRAINEKTELAFLFADLAQLVLKAPDDLAAVIQNRINAHQAIDAARIETERQRIANDERTKAEAAAKTRADAEIAAATVAAQAEAARASAEAISAAQAPATPEIAAAVQMVQVMGMTIPREMLEATQFAKDYPLPDTLPVTYVGAEPPELSHARLELNQRLDCLSEAEILRVLNFVRSRYGVQVAA